MNHAVLHVLRPEHVEVEICRAEELEYRRGLTSELDEMWSYVRSKANPRCGPAQGTQDTCGKKFLPTPKNQ